MNEPNEIERFLALLQTSIDDASLRKLVLSKHHGEPADLLRSFGASFLLNIFQTLFIILLESLEGLFLILNPRKLTLDFMRPRIDGAENVFPGEFFQHEKDDSKSEDLDRDFF